MLSQVKKIMDPAGRKDVAGRFGAWWDGREYQPEAGADEEAGKTATSGEGGAVDEARSGAAEGGVADERPVIPPARTASDGARINALERLWGVGRFGPGACEPEILDLLEADLLSEGDIGMMGADPALLRAWTRRSDRTLLASEWRSDALERVQRAVPGVTVVNDDIDRAKAFPDAGLAALATINTIAFADHKAGLVARAFHALKDGGRWVIFDTVRTTTKAPATAFASAWAEPQLADEAEVDDLLEKSGFANVSKQNVTAEVIEIARGQMEALGAALETTVAEGMAGAEGVLFLRELVWELKSWRARLKALEGGALQIVMWSAIKGERPQSEPPLDEELAEAVEEMENARAKAQPAAEEAAAPKKKEGRPDDEMTARIAAMVASVSGGDGASDDAELDESLFDKPD